jgi:hypothetical protein
MTQSQAGERRGGLPGRGTRGKRVQTSNSEGRDGRRAQDGCKRAVRALARVPVGSRGSRKASAPSEQETTPSEALASAVAKRRASGVAGCLPMVMPFLQEDLPMLLQDAPSILQKRVPRIQEIFARWNWKLPAHIDRVYVIEKAEQHLGYHPLYGFNEFVQSL